MQSSAYLAYRIIDSSVDGLFSILDNVEASLGSIEAVVFDESKSSASAINAARRQIAILRRIVFPLGLYIPDLVIAQKFSKEDLSIYFSDVRHKIGKVSATIEEMKEMVEIYKDTDFVTSSNKTNTVLSVLTILFTLTIPATVISSIYGMNVPLPGGLVTGPLEFLGPYTSLIFIFLAMLVPAVIMALYFKRVAGSRREPPRVRPLLGRSAGRDLESSGALSEPQGIARPAIPKSVSPCIGSSRLPPPAVSSTRRAMSDGTRLELAASILLDDCL